MDHPVYTFSFLNQICSHRYGLNHIDVLSTHYATFSVMKKQNENFIYYVLFNGGSFMAFAVIEKIYQDKDYWKLKILERRKGSDNIKSDDLCAALFHYIVIDDEKNLISDENIEMQTINFWYNTYFRFQDFDLWLE